MLLTAYDTTVGSSAKLEQLVISLKEAFIKEDANLINLDTKPTSIVSFVFTTGKIVSDANIPIYLYPTLVSYKEKNYLCTDIRFCLKATNRAEINKIDLDVLDFRVGGDFDFARDRAIIQALWLDNERQSMRLDLEYAGLIYAFWVSDIITKRFSLDTRDSMYICIIAHLFYQMQFYEKEAYDDILKNKFIIHSTNILQYPAQLIGEIADKMHYGNTINDICANIRKINSNIRLNDLNPGTLVTSSANSWTGYEGKIMVSVALEHIPTWLCVVNSSITERMHKNSLIARIASRFQRNDVSANYIKVMGQYIRPHLPS